MVNHTTIRDRVRNLFAFAVRATFDVAVNSRLRRLTAVAMESIDDGYRISTRHGTLKIGISNSFERWRAETLLDKEPETIAWLDRTIDPSSVLYDVGANIGIYSLYALHLSSTTRVVAFEPESLNYARLNLNIHRNDWTDRAIAFGVGLGSANEVVKFRLSKLEAGHAMHGDNIQPGKEDFQQGCVIAKLDDFLDAHIALPAPTHLKIDVDGPELDILLGAQKCLRSPQLRHILIEMEENNKARGLQMLEAAGFELVETGPTVNGMGNLILRKS